MPINKWEIAAVEYWRTNKFVMELHLYSIDDYIASRCLMQNGMLGKSYIMAAQSLEKQCKAILLLVEPEVNIDCYKDHKVSRLLRRIKSKSNIDLDQFIELGDRLYMLYELERYPNSKTSETVKSYSKSSSDLMYIDEFFCHLFDVSPMPIEVKFAGQLMRELYDNEKSHRNIHWFTNGNIAYGNRRENWFENYRLLKEVE